MLNIVSHMRQVHGLFAIATCIIIQTASSACAPASVSVDRGGQQTAPTPDVPLQISTQSWQLAAQKVEYTVFMPSYVPGTLTPGWPSFDQQTGAVVQNYSSAAEASVLMIIQRSHTNAPSDVPGIPVQIGDAVGSYWKKDGRQWLFLRRKDTFIELQVFSMLELDEMIRILESLRPVP